RDATCEPAGRAPPAATAPAAAARSGDRCARQPWTKPSNLCASIESRPTPPTRTAAEVRASPVGEPPRFIAASGERWLDPTCKLAWRRQPPSRAHCARTADRRRAEAARILRPCPLEQRPRAADRQSATPLSIYACPIQRAPGRR